MRARLAAAPHEEDAAVLRAQVHPLPGLLLLEGGRFKVERLLLNIHYYLHLAGGSFVTRSLVHNGQPDAFDINVHNLPPDFCVNVPYFVT